MPKYLKIKLFQKKVYLLFFIPFLVIFSGIIFFNIYHKDRIYPGVNIDGYYVGSRTKAEALDILGSKIIVPKSLPIKAKNQSFELSLAEIGFNYDLQTSVNSAFKEYRNGPVFPDMLTSFTSLFNTKEIELKSNLNQIKISEYLEIISGQLAVEPVAPSADLINGAVVINKGAPGENIDKDEFLKTLTLKLRNQDYSPIDIVLVAKDPALTDEEVEAFKLRAEKLVNKTLVLKHEFDDYILKDAEMIKLLSAREGVKDEVVDEYIEKQLVPKVNREPQNAIFKFENGKVEEFKPAKNGATINRILLKNEINQRLTALENSEEKSLTLNIPIESTDPKITTDQVNTLGIKELVGRGTSKFKGSISGRIHNIGLASSNLNGTLIPPGEIFSFNTAVGDVSSLTGYKQAYIIKDGKTVLGDGGGLCQVSTTLFRAALNAGLPITERRAHSYRVGYYEQDSGPGIDATVYSPTTDFKFKNDTPGYLLIQTIFNPESVSLAFEIYGTSDGRTATVTKPVVTSVSAPPPDLYVDDPTLKTGQVKQIEHKAWGAKVSFNYKVERNGEILIDKNFLSNYRPWQAVFLKGTAPIQ